MILWENRLNITSSTQLSHSWMGSNDSGMPESLSWFYSKQCRRTCNYSGSYETDAYGTRVDSGWFEWRRFLSGYICQRRDHSRYGADIKRSSQESAGGTYPCWMMQLVSNECISFADTLIWDPAYLLRNSLVSPSLLAGIWNAKYVNATPLYRQEQEFQRMGLNIDRADMAYWTILCAERQIVLYDYQPSRNASHPRAFWKMENCQWITTPQNNPFVLSALERKTGLW